MKKIIGVGIAVLVVGVVAVYAMNPLMLTVTGFGEVEVPADTAVLAFTIAQTNASPAVAQMNLQNQATALKAVLTDNGFKEADIIMSQPTMVIGNGGYQASMSMGGKTSKVKDVNVLAALLYERGAVYVSQPVLSVEAPDKWQAAALNKAIANANAKASQVNTARFKLVKKIVSAIESADTPVQATVATQVTPVNTKTGQANLGVAAADTIKISKTVVTTYKMW